MAGRSQILVLYKTMLREAAKFPDFNFRSYAQRRVQDAFQEAKALTDSTEITNQMRFANDNLAVIRRQTTIGHLFNTNEKLSIEVMSGGKK
jgi:hypothetical protein